MAPEVVGSCERKAVKYLRTIGAILALIGALVGASSGAASAQTFSDPVMRTVRVVATCEGMSGFSGSVEIHFHTFGSVTIGPPREISPPPMRCTRDEPVTEVEIFAAVPMIWHAYVNVLDASSPRSMRTCEIEGQTLPASTHCPAEEGAVMLDIAEVPEDGETNGAP